jgi:hypothetical protein
MAVGDTFNRVRGWIGGIFSLGIDGPEIAVNGVAVEILEPGEVAGGDYALLRADENAVATNDVLTKGRGDALYAAAGSGTSGAERYIIIPFTTAQFDGLATVLPSTASLPSGAKIVTCKIRVKTVFDNVSHTITVGSNFSLEAAAFSITTDSKLTKQGTYEMHQFTDHGGAGASKGLVTPSATTDAVGTGTGDVIIGYTVPDA